MVKVLLVCLHAPSERAVSLQAVLKRGLARASDIEVSTKPLLGWLGASVRVQRHLVHSLYSINNIDVVVVEATDAYPVASEIAWLYAQSRPVLVVAACEGSASWERSDKASRLKRWGLAQRGMQPPTFIHYALDARVDEHVLGWVRAHGS